MPYGRGTMRTRSPLSLLPLLAFAVLPVGCSDRTADLQQQIMALRAEAERARADLQKAEGELERLRGHEPRAPATAEIDRSALESGYEAAARALREQVQQQLTEAQVERFTLFRPQFEEFPHRSEFSMEVRTGGRRLQIDRIPVKATAQGRWVFPSAAEVASRIEQARNAPATPTSPNVAEPSSPDRPPEVVAPTPSNETVVLDWGDARGTASSRSGAASGREPPAPRPPPAGGRTPASADRPSTPVQVMPAQRDVLIHFP